MEKLVAELNLYRLPLCLHTGLISRRDNEAMLDIAAEELRTAIKQLGRITGRVGVEEILDVVFKDFCIGK